MNKCKFKITEMHCEGCKNRIINILNKLNENINVSIDLEEKKAEITYPDTVSKQEIIDKIQILGFSCEEINE